ncbi:MAG: hypothetical protein O3B13_23445 [Planctomycetota bacterium]|nr:hypothetical protein [Planctomycetota bacterium]
MLQSLHCSKIATKYLGQALNIGIAVVRFGVSFGFRGVMIAMTMARKALVDSSVTPYDCCISRCAAGVSVCGRV